MSATARVDRTLAGVDAGVGVTETPAPLALRSDPERPRDRTPRRLFRVLSTAVALPVAVLQAGCGILRRSEIPVPFGPASTYGEIVTDIRIEGNDVTDEGIIRNTLVSRVGNPYTLDDANRDYLRLLQLGVFTSIVFRTEETPGGVGLVVEVAEASPYLPVLSIALTEENGLEIGPGFSSPNLFGRAGKSSVYMRFGGARNNGVSYKDSWRPSTRWYGCCWAFEYFHRERANALDDFDEVSDEVTLQFLGNVTDRLHVGPRLSWMSIREKVDTVVKDPPVILDSDRKDQVPGLGLVVEYDGRNLSNYPTTGWYLSTSATQYGGPLGGASNFPRLEVDLRRYFELDGAIHSLALYSLLSVTGGTVGVDIPVHQDFSLGGTNSVRGWPLDARSGKSQWINTAEYWWNILPREAYQVWFVRWSMGLQLAAFADVGTAWNSTSELQDAWIAGGGVGARLTIPQVGLIRFDVAVGERKPSFELMFHIGGSEKAIAQRDRVR